MLKNKKTGGEKRILYPPNLFFENESKIKIFPDEQRVGEFVASKTALHEILKEVLQGERKWYQMIKNPGKEIKSSGNGKYGG